MREIWPNFFLVGAAKAGTISIYEYLSQHPEIFFPCIKEPHFFTQARPSRQQRFFVHAISDRAEYARLFERACGFATIGDASPSYLWHPEVPCRIRAQVPDARIAIILRDPVERAYSHYLAAPLSRPSRIRALTINLGTYAIALLIIWLLARDISIRRFAESLLHARLSLFIPAAIASILFWFVGDTVTYARLLSYFHVPTRFREMLPGTAGWRVMISKLETMTHVAEATGSRELAELGYFQRCKRIGG